MATEDPGKINPGYAAFVSETAFAPEKPQYTEMDQPEQERDSVEVNEAEPSNEDPVYSRITPVPPLAANPDSHWQDEVKDEEPVIEPNGYVTNDVPPPIPSRNSLTMLKNDTPTANGGFNRGVPIPIPDGNSHLDSSSYLTPSVTPNNKSAFDLHSGLRHGGGTEREGAGLRPVTAPPAAKPAADNDKPQEYVNKGYVLEQAKKKNTAPGGPVIDYSHKPKPSRHATGFAPASRNTPAGVLPQTFGRKHQLKYGSQDYGQSQMGDSNNPMYASQPQMHSSASQLFMESQGQLHNPMYASQGQMQSQDHEQLNDDLNNEML
jgi:hypothetical protein